MIIFMFSIFMYNGIPEFTAFVCSTWLSEGSLVLMAACSVRSNCVLYLVVVSIVVHGCK